MQNSPGVAIVTGGTGAIGRAVATRFLEEGYIVAIPYIIPEELELLRKTSANNKDLHTEMVDVMNREAIDTFVRKVASEHGSIRVLVNLIGGYMGGQKVAEVTEEDWDRMFRLNVKPPFLTCRAVLPYMEKDGWGRIINVSSESALKGDATLSAYAASKAGVMRLTESIADEYRMKGITANSVAPRIVDTPSNREAIPDANYDTWPKPDEIAELILFLSSDKAKSITGVTIPVIGRA